jgi:hypothetical protein
MIYAVKRQVKSIQTVHPTAEETVPYVPKKSLPPRPLVFEGNEEVSFVITPKATFTA